MNKAEFVDALVKHVGDRKTALTALDGVLEEIQRAVSRGDKVSFAGFGVFEKRARAARMARNPRTGEAVRVKKTVVPAFRPGQGFKDLVTGAKKMPKKTSAKKTTAGKGTAKRTTAKKTAPAKKTTAKKTAPAKKATTRKAAAKKTVRSAAKTTQRAVTTKRVSTAKKSTAKRGSTAKKTASKSTRKRLINTRTMAGTSGVHLFG